MDLTEEQKARAWELIKSGIPDLLDEMSEKEALFVIRTAIVIGRDPERLAGACSCVMGEVAA